MSTTVIVVKHSQIRCCTTCDKPMKRNRLQVRSSVVSAGGRPLTFAVGVFCSVSCLMRFAAGKKKANQATIRGWTFGDAEIV